MTAARVRGESQFKDGSRGRVSMLLAGPEEEGGDSGTYPLDPECKSIAVVTPVTKSVFLYTAECDVAVDSKPLRDVPNTIELHEGQTARVTSRLHKQGERPLSITVEIKPSMREFER
ncbi:hypothetical protein A2Z00_04425 [Candidatus Gottesmanbacteria bacterium RBG_13_45_10]|uniref:Uncharacterized protein n=1 Tax=Candidatus Gottesmanbacteria bacterium RBG_13_45_10 TaxID=1798370 RepID=A0A1F5ZIM7_9BACT|nr:MAG: hypothetical protein A2Z00_04425 [Candidatus Gottesmanbacteria bacterium RBG_13_45_10]